MEPLHECGYKVRGIEVSEDAASLLSEKMSSRVSICDFKDATGSFDLVCCVEVTEHIEPARSEELVSKLCTLSERYVYFTAAQPGQGGAWTYKRASTQSLD